MDVSHSIQYQPGLFPQYDGKFLSTHFFKNISESQEGLLPNLIMRRECHMAVAIRLIGSNCAPLNL